MKNKIKPYHTLYVLNNFYFEPNKIKSLNNSSCSPVPSISTIIIYNNGLKTQNFIYFFDFAKSYLEMSETGHKIIFKHVSNPLFPILTII